MANSYSFPVAYANMLDRIYKYGSVTAVLEAANTKYRFSEVDAKTIYLQKISLQGLADYTRDTGYGSGDIGITWGAHTMAVDRSKKFILDVLDAREAYLQIAQIGAEFMRTKVVPEIDAYRFHKICSLCSVDTTGTLTWDTVIAAINTGSKTLDDAEVPKEGRVLFVSNETYQNMKKSGEFNKTIIVTNNSGNINTEIATYDGMVIIPVPSTRFYTIFDFANTSAGGFTVNASGKAINFMIVYAPEIIAVIKHMAPKIVNPEVNQTADGWIYGFRIYHDLFIAENKLTGVYVHSKS
jgi:hypothetical protein